MSRARNTAEARYREDKPSKRKPRSVKRAKFVDMRPDDHDKEVVAAYLEKWEDIWALVGDAIASDEISATLSWSEKDECWALRASSRLEKWPDITYYTFRNVSLIKVLGYALYIFKDVWQGVLPEEGVKDWEVNW